MMGHMGQQKMGYITSLFRIIIQQQGRKQTKLDGV